MPADYTRARKSVYGKELSFLLEPETPLRPSQVIMRAVPPSLSMPDELAKEVKRQWEAKTSGKKSGPDGMKWRYEGHLRFGDRISLYVSPIMYSWHNILRDSKGKPYEFYPTPLTVNSVQETTDKKIPIAVRGKASDQKGLCFLGSGFIDRFAGDDVGTTLLYTPFNVVNDECSDETEYDVTLPGSGFNIQKSGILGLARGSNTDIAVITHVPLYVSSEQVHLNPENHEHDDLLFLSTDEKTLRTFLETGGTQGARAADHLLGGIELYLLHKYAKRTI